MPEFPPHTAEYADAVRLMVSDILTVLQPRPRDNQGKPIAFRPALRPTDLRWAAQAQMADPESDVERRAEILAGLVGVDEPYDALSTGIWLNAYLYSDCARQVLGNRLGYLAGSFMAWEDRQILVPSVDADVGQDIVRPPWLIEGELAGLRRSFRSLLCPAGRDLNRWTLEEVGEGRTTLWASLEAYFPHLSLDELRRCVSSEFSLFPRVSTDGQRDAASAFWEFFVEWLGDDSMSSCRPEHVDERLRGAGWNIQHGQDGYKLFWFLAYGIFVRGLMACTAKYYRLQQDRFPMNPYSASFAAGRNYVQRLSVFYIPHAQVLSAFIEICVQIRRALIEEGTEDAAAFDQSAKRLLERVGAVVGSEFSPSLAVVPSWLKANQELIRSDLAGEPCTLDVPPKVKAERLEEVASVYGFSPQNLVHYLAADTLPVANGTASPTRRCVVWFPLWAIRPGTRDGALSGSLMVFVANMNELVLAAGQRPEDAEGRIAALREVFSPVGIRCLDIFEARRMADQRASLARTLVSSHLFASNIHNLARGGQLADLRKWLSGAIKRSNLPPQLSGTLQGIQDCLDSFVGLMRQTVEVFGRPKALFQLPLRDARRLVSVYTEFQRTYTSAESEIELFKYPPCRLDFAFHGNDDLQIPTPTVLIIIHLAQHAIEAHRAFLDTLEDGDTRFSEAVSIVARCCDAPLSHLEITVSNFTTSSPDALMQDHLERRFVDDSLQRVWEEHEITQGAALHQDFVAYRCRDNTFDALVRLPYNLPKEGRLSP